MQARTMPASPHPEPLGVLQGEIEGLLQRLRHPMLVENEVELMDLSAAQWRLTLEFGKLIFSAWNSGKSVSRRVEELAYRDRDRFGIFVRKPGGRESSTLDFRELHAPVIVNRAAGRAGFRQQLTALLEREYRGWKFERFSNRSDREHSFSAWYTRGVAKQGRSAWAFLGLGEEEGPAAADGVLAFGLIWLDWLRSQADRVAITQLKLFLPPAAVSVIAHRAAYLNARALDVEIYEWRAGQPSATRVELKDYGNVETHLAARRQAELLKENHASFLHDLLDGLSAGIEIVPDSNGTYTSLRIAGLEVGRIEGQLAPRVYFGLEGSFRRLDESNHDEFKDFLREVGRIRCAGSTDPQHQFYRLQSERWLESLLFQDITRLDPALSPEHVYPQVPAFSGTDRGVIDLLTATRRGRLAVVELKVHEEINLPLQGLDYWLRVNWLQKRNQFQEFGYFQGCELSPAAPLLYLVSPAFRFHSTTEKILRYFDHRIEVILIGINDTWRKKIQVLFRHPIPWATSA
ncbi:MAG TPA: hypothetical protein VEN79_02920 [Terriglobia bacterium]|nr:hypothetical protein [Terriglobia bacterium]